MLDVRWIREEPAALDRALARRHSAARAGDILALDERRRSLIASLQAMQERRNAASKEIGAAKAAKDEARAAALMAEVTELKTRMPEDEVALKAAEAALDAALAELPNVPLDEVPEGADEKDNLELRQVGARPAFDFTPRQHFEIGEALGLMDFEAASKLSGARFVVLKGALARLERALGQFMLDLHTDQHGYTEVQPPLLVKDAALYGTAQLPKFAEDQFRTTDGFWLIPTAEVPLTNLVREQMLDEAALPLRFTALTPCFRSEAGSAGRDTRGMLRQHQFDKVEMVSITTPETSIEEHERMTGCAEAVLKALGLPYRVVVLCTGDMGFASQKTYDIEVWLPGQDTFREISSCSVCGDFQARRMNARYRPAEGKGPRYVHTLNGSGIAVGRALIAVMENYQTADGAVMVPEVLRPYMGGITKIERAA
ncbi:serine--tRNA ligase [Pseudoxanthobacter sp. M-2]|uniref:serine--tRNA ligase n=1 Tax=Pseudoxanthobacter sp. M-2 TaxID=3078754 RepID=UPI0038FBF83F